MDIVRVGVTNDEIAQTVFGPSFHIERQVPVPVLCRCESAVQLILEYENRYLVFCYGENQVSARRLRQVGHSPAYQRVWSFGKFRKVKRKRQLSLEPGLDRMPVGGN